MGILTAGGGIVLAPRMYLEEEESAETGVSRFDRRALR